MAQGADEQRQGGLWLHVRYRWRSPTRSQFDAPWDAYFGPGIPQIVKIGRFFHDLATLLPLAVKSKFENFRRLII